MAKKTSSKKTSAKKTNTKEKEYAAQYLSQNLKMPNEEIAKELGVTVAQVDTMLNSSEQPVNKETKKTSSRSHNLMIRHTSAKKNNNVSIMTEAASQYNDEVKKNLKKKNNNKNFRDCTYSPRND